MAFRPRYANNLQPSTFNLQPSTSNLQPSTSNQTTKQANNQTTKQANNLQLNYDPYSSH
ncbi:MAG: hypothetical protein F6J90_10385 [Moorea sp. SIOASIH]|uniref:hypothetical protein n=1 Tax=Moorena sp. SIOASIH TaxID=2607817 RepID=UPI0013B90206|nr:hypothetical protein [Moorena sp. SIOASIH]NEO36711.1 hypothetical protein [Moorena sp. SIOASIH]